MSALLALISKAKQKYSSADDALRPKDGKNTYRILAPTKEQAEWVGPDGEFWQDVGVHWIKADLNGKPLAVVGDASVCFGQLNPLDAIIEKAVSQSIGEEDKKLAESWRSQKRILLNVLDRSDKNAENPQVLEVTRTTWASILEQAQTFAQAGFNIFDQAMGLDINIVKTGKNLNTKYDVSITPLMPGQSPVPVSDEVMSKCVDLPNWVRNKYFKGEEDKAAALIAQTAGIALPGGAPAVTARTPTAALTSGAAVAEGAQVAAMTAATASVATAAPAVEEATVVETATATAGTATVATEDPDQALAELDALLNGQL